MELIWHVINVDNEQSKEEMEFYQSISDTIKVVKDRKIKRQLKKIRDLKEFDENQLFTKILKEDNQTQQYLFEVACTTVLIDKKIHDLEIKFLEKMAKELGINFSRKNLKI